MKKKIVQMAAIWDVCSLPRFLEGKRHHIFLQEQNYAYKLFCNLFSSKKLCRTSSTGRTLLVCSLHGDKGKVDYSMRSMQLSNSCNSQQYSYFMYYLEKRILSYKMGHTHYVHCLLFFLILHCRSHIHIVCSLPDFLFIYVIF